MTIIQYAVIGIYPNHLTGAEDTTVIGEFDELETANEIKAHLEDIKDGYIEEIEEEIDDEKKYKEHLNALQTLSEEFGIHLEFNGYIATPTVVKIWKTEENE